ncbi:TolC family protein [Ectothiorhodospiraceae bacterium BW-2]|nr:TolC family protein [Ectothiorhodospiraceae bacterium BW-2]
MGKYLILTMLLFSLDRLAAEVLSFSDLYQLSLRNSRDIKSYEFQTESQQELVKQAKSKLYPKINFASYYKISDQQLNSTYSFNTDQRIKQTLNSNTISIEQLIYDKSVYSGISIEEMKSELSRMELELKKQELAQELFKVYLDILKSKNKIDYHRYYLQYTESKLKAIEKKYKLNLANKMDFLEANVDKNSAIVNLNKEDQVFNLNRLKLSRYIGGTEFDLPKVFSDSLSMQHLEIIKNHILDDGANISAGLRLNQARLTMEMRKLEVERAYDTYYPTLGMSASYSQYDTDTPTTDSQYDVSQQLMINLKLPLYSGGYLSSTLSQAKLALMAANETFLSEQEQAALIYDELLLKFNSAIETIQIYNGAIESAKLYVKALEQGYNHQLRSIIELEEAKSKLAQVEYQYIDSLYEMIDAYIGLLILTNKFDNIYLLDDLIT